MIIVSVFPWRRVRTLLFIRFATFAGNISCILKSVWIYLYSIHFHILPKNKHMDGIRYRKAQHKRKVKRTASSKQINKEIKTYLSQLMRLWYLPHRRPTKAQASLRILAVSPEPSLFAHMKYGNRRRVRPKIRHLSPLDDCTCVFEEWVHGGRKVP